MSLDPHRKADLLARDVGEDRWRMEHGSMAGQNGDGDNDESFTEHQSRRRLPPRPCAPPPITPPPFMEIAKAAAAATAPSQPTADLDPARKRYAEDFIMGRHLGEGSYSTVILATEKLTKKKFAIKVLDKRHIVKEKKTKYVNIEKLTLNKLHHPLIIKLFYTFQDAQSLYFALELAPNGELLTWLRKLGSFDEACSRFYAAEIAQAVNYLHTQGVVHRDLKPENILLDERMHIKLTDFGTAKLFEPADKDANNDRSNSFVGTAEYVSPELLTNKSATRSCDWWAFGCIVYQLLAGRPPFKAANEYLTFQKIIQLEYKFPPGFPPEARDLVEKLLVLNPDHRLGSGNQGMDTLQTHPFFASIDWDQLVLQTPPRLLPYLPPVDHHNQMPLRSNSEAMLFQPDRQCPETPQIDPDLLISDNNVRVSYESHESDGIPWDASSLNYNDNGHVNTNEDDDGDDEYDGSVLMPPPRLRVMNDGGIRSAATLASATSSMGSSIISAIDEQARLQHPYAVTPINLIQIWILLICQLHRK
ncbi:kinase-like domain-containing protein [Syncephalis fuscata]|nr:kinase-like domain-containing protein [Syncephalis fuscata]